MFTPILADTTTTAADPSGGLLSSLMLPGLLVLMLVAMYFFMIRPQRRQQKKEKELRANIRVGDEVVTIGGVVGRVIKVLDDDIVIETGADRNRITFKKWSVQVNNTVHEPTVDDDDDDDDD